MTSADALPAGFDDFLPFMSWALPTQSARCDKKLRSTFDELTALYNLGMQDSRVLDALEYCDRFPLDGMPADALCLFRITLSIAEVRPQVELYGRTDPPNAAMPSRLRMTPESDTR